MKMNENYAASGQISYTTRTATRGFRHGHRSSPFDPLVLHVRLDALADLTRLVIRLWPIGIFKEPLLLRNDTPIRKPGETFISAVAASFNGGPTQFRTEKVSTFFIRFSLVCFNFFLERRNDGEARKKERKLNRSEGNLFRHSSNGKNRK